VDLKDNLEGSGRVIFKDIAAISDLTKYFVRRTREEPVRIANLRTELQTSRLLDVKETCLKML
jgi:hypothetical protein